MKNIIKNVLLIIALSAVIVMVIGIFLYDYIPSSTTVAEPHTYKADEKTTKVLAEIAEESSSLGTNDNSSVAGTKSNVVLKSYSITETDLAIYSASHEYEKGKADPFAEATQPSNNSGNGENSSSSGTQGSSTNNSSSNSSSGSNSSSSSGTTSDGTLFNSKASK